MIKTDVYSCPCSIISIMNIQCLMMSKGDFPYEFSLSINFVTFFSFQLSESGIYKMPLVPNKITSIEYINSLPLTPSPEVFGLHENADISKNYNETTNVS